MTITLEPELEKRVQEAAARMGQNLDGYVKAALLRQVAADESKAAPLTESLWSAMQAAAQDPLFLQDIAEIEQAFRSSDSETARMLADD